MKKTLTPLLFLLTMFACCFNAHASNPTVTAMPGVTICIGTCDSLKAQASGGTAPYTYSWSAYGTPSSSSVCPVNTTTYTVIATDHNGLNSAPATVKITVNPPLEVVPSYGGSVCPGSTFPLNATGSGGNGSYSYTWLPSANLSNPNIPNPVASPTSTTTYTVIVQDNCGTPPDSTYSTVTVLPKLFVATLSTDSAGCVPFCAHFHNNTSNSCVYAVWDFGDGHAAQGCDSASHCYPVPGTYSVTTTVTDNNGCQGSNTIQVFALSCTGIQESEWPDQDVKLFPNPFTDQLNLHFDTSDLNRTITLYDALGKKVLAAAATEQAPVLNLASLPSGIYFLQIHSRKENIIRKINKL